MGKLKKETDDKSLKKNLLKKNFIKKVLNTTNQLQDEDNLYTNNSVSKTQDANELFEAITSSNKDNSNSIQQVESTKNAIRNPLSELYESENIPNTNSIQPNSTKGANFGFIKLKKEANQQKPNTNTNSPWDIDFTGNNSTSSNQPKNDSQVFINTNSNISITVVQNSNSETSSKNGFSFIDKKKKPKVENNPNDILSELDGINLNDNKDKNNSKKVDISDILNMAYNDQQQTQGPQNNTNQQQHQNIIPPLSQSHQQNYTPYYGNDHYYSYPQQQQNHPVNIGYNPQFEHGQPGYYYQPHIQAQGYTNIGQPLGFYPLSNNIQNSNNQSQQYINNHPESRENRQNSDKLKDKFSFVSDMLKPKS
jgi:hypothetical protein